MSRSSLERARQRGGPSFLSQKIDEKNRMKESISQHVTGLPPSLLKLFEARTQPPHMDPIKKKKPALPYTGVAQYVGSFAEPGDQEYEPPPSETRPPEPRIFRNPELAAQARVESHSKPEKEVYLAQERARRHKESAEEAAAIWDPHKDPSVEGDPFKTLFVSRLSYDVSERKLRREFEEFGPIKRIRLVHDKNNGKPRGYAFIEFESKSGMKEAYKAGDGRKIEGRRCLVDVERGRTVPHWRPRRLGGGKGGESRAPRPPKDPKRQFVARLVEDSMRKVREAEAAAAAPPEPRRGEGDDARRDREGRSRSREREREVAREVRDRSDRDREQRGGRDRDRREGRGGDREREDRRDDRKRDRSRDRSARGYDRSGGGDRGRDRDYAAVPPPGYVAPAGRYADDELEEGETRMEDGGERYAKRSRGRERDAL